MVEKTKANQGASVSKTGNISVETSKSKTHWDQGEASDEQQLESCQDNSTHHTADADPPLQTEKTPPRAKKPAAKHEISEQIGRQLRNVYDDVLAQPVPDRFLDLLRALEKDHK
jgi:hypothetical protein